MKRSGKQNVASIVVLGIFFLLYACDDSANRVIFDGGNPPSESDAWSAFGLTMGSFHEVAQVIEGYQSSGSADVRVSFQ